MSTILKQTARRKWAVAWAEDMEAVGSLTGRSAAELYRKIERKRGQVAEASGSLPELEAFFGGGEQ